MSDVKLTTFSTNADFSAELESHAFTALLKSLSVDFIRLAITNKDVLLLVPRKESLVLVTVDGQILNAHLFYRNPNDIFQLISFTGQKAYISRSRVYLFGQIVPPPGQFIWTMAPEILWSKFELPKDLGGRNELILEKYDSIQLISNIPTLCYISSCNQSILATMIRRPVPEGRDVEKKSDKEPSSMIMQISNSMPTFFNKSATTIDILSPDSRLNDIDYACYSKHIQESKFYIVALETKSFLNHFINNKPERFSDVSNGMGKFVRKIEACINKIPLDAEVYDSFKRGLMSHVLCKIHQAITNVADIEQEKYETFFQMKLSLIQLSGFSFKDLGVEGMSDIEKSLEWNNLVLSVGSKLVFLSKSISMKFMIRNITDIHQTISAPLEKLPFSKSISNTDSLLPSLILVIIRSHPPKIFTIFYMLMKSYNFMRLDGVDQYCLTNFIAAITYIKDSIDLKKLELPSVNHNELEELSISLKNQN